MALYRYFGKDKEARKIQGILEAPNESRAIEELHKRGFTIVSLVQIKKRRITLGRKRVKLDDLVIFSRQLATLIDSGIPLVQSLEILAEQIENKYLSGVISETKLQIERGRAFCDALSVNPKVFSEFYISMVRAGETSGALKDILERIAGYFEKASSLRKKIRSSLMYPAVVVTMAILITALLLLKVVPTFKGIFELLGGVLPLPTRILIGISDLFTRYFLILIGILILFSLLFKRYLATEKGRYNFDKRILKLPVFGQLLLKFTIAKFSRTLSVLVKSGVPILNSLEIVSSTVGNKVIEEAIRNCQTAVREGESIAYPLAESGVFPPMVTRMISVGEKTGQLENMLSKIAQFYEDEVDSTVSGLMSMIEPVIIVFLGIVIGGIVISLFLPVFKITQLIAR
jgi:type IV pilus assembly protein PilC